MQPLPEKGEEKRQKWYLKKFLKLPKYIKPKI